MALDLSSLEKAVSSLEKSLKVADRTIKGKVNTDEEETVRAGVIQNFEFTFELCWKYIKRWIEANNPDPVDGVTRRELFRLAAESELIINLEAWFEYYKARNLTSHTYDSNKANQVYEVARRFAIDARHLLMALKSKND
jgi:nucleotidyltransferase substrate binding protein (TIGR01987 family)